MSKKTLLLLAAVLSMAGFLRFYHLASTPPGLFPDEAMDGNNALEAIHTGDFKVFYLPNNGEEGLFAYIEALGLAVTGTPEPWNLRLPSALFGLLTVLGLFLLVRELFRKDAIALLAAFFLATSFWHINFSRIGFRGIMAPFFLVWALWCFLVAVRSPHRWSSAWLAATAGAFFGLGFYSYIPFRIAPLLFIVVVALFWRTGRVRSATAIFAAVGLLVALPIGLWFIHNPEQFVGRASQVSIWNSPQPTADLFANVIRTIGMLDLHGDSNWRHNISGRPELFWPVGVAFWVGAIVGIVTLWRKNGVGDDRAGMQRTKAIYLICFAWIILAALPAVLSNDAVPHALRSILMLPPIMAIAAVGGIWIYEESERRLGGHAKVAAPFFATVLALVLASETYAYFDTWAVMPSTADAFTADLLALGYRLRDLPQETPKYVLIGPGGGTVAQVDPWDPGGRIQEIPIGIQTVMFLTDSYRPEEQRQKNIHYVLMEDKASIPVGSLAFVVTMH